MVVETLLLVILFVINPFLALIALAVIAITTLMFYAALKAIALASLIITSLPAIVIAAAILTATIVAAVALQVTLETLSAVSQFLLNTVQSIGSAALSIFYPEQVGPTTASAISSEEALFGQRYIPTAIPIIEVHNQATYHRQDPRFFKQPTAPMAPPGFLETPASNPSNPFVWRG